MYLACEGRFLVVAAKEDEKKILSVMKKDTLGRKARVIGRVTRDNAGKVYMNTVSGGKRIVSMLSGEQLPRIC